MINKTTDKWVNGGKNERRRKTKWLLISMCGRVNKKKERKGPLCKKTLHRHRQPEETKNTA